MLRKVQVIVMTENNWNGIPPQPEGTEPNRQDNQNYNPTINNESGHAQENETIYTTQNYPNGWYNSMPHRVEPNGGDPLYDSRQPTPPAVEQHPGNGNLPLQAGLLPPPVIQPPPYYDKRQNQSRKKGGGSFRKLAATAVVAAVLTGSVTTGIFTYQSEKRYQDLENQISALASQADGNSSVSQISLDSSYKSAVSAIAEKVSPSVVGVVTTGMSQSSGFGFGFSPSTETESETEGSGVIYTADGYIITNYHVIELAVESKNQNKNWSVTVYLDGDVVNGVSADIVGYDVSADLAVLKIDKTGLTPIEIADSDQVQVGETAIAIGNPGGLNFYGSVSYGVVSGLNREITMENGTMSLIQTDAAINSGNSGGALVDGQGKLIGINSVKSAQYENMGFAIPSNYVVETVDRIIANEGSTEQSYLGLGFSDQYNADTLTAMGYPAGVVVAYVSSDSPAEEAGIQKGDIITAVNGTSIRSYEALLSEKNKYKPGETITLTVYRLGETIDIPVTLGTMSS